MSGPCRGAIARPETAQPEHEIYAMGEKTEGIEMNKLNKILALCLALAWAVIAFFYTISKLPKKDDCLVIMDSSYCKIDEGCRDVVIAGCTNIEVKTSNVLVDGYFGKRIIVDYMSHEHALSIVRQHWK
jgi:hypothetical protein